MFTNREYRYSTEMDRIERSALRRTGSNADRYVYASLLMQMLCAGSVAGSIGHLKYKHQIYDLYDIIVDSTLALFFGAFWLYISPQLDACFQSEGMSIAVMQSIRAIAAIITLVAEIHEHSLVICISSTFFLMLDPVFPKAIPIVARITKRDRQVSVLSAFTTCGACAAGLTSLFYYFFGSIPGICLQIIVFVFASIYANDLDDRDIEFEFELSTCTHSNLGRTFLWFCVFPAGATTTLISYDLLSLTCQKSNNEWTVDECDERNATMISFSFATCCLATWLLHRNIPPEGQPRLESLTWFTAYFITGAGLSQILGTLAEKRLHKDYTIISRTLR